MQLDGLASGIHQLFGHLFVRDGENELVRLEAARIRRTNAGLNQSSLVGLEHDAFIDNVIQSARLHARGKREVVIESAHDQ